jgi:hypothetical protein
MRSWLNEVRFVLDQHMSLHSDTLFWFRVYRSLLFLLNGACLAEKQQIPILYSLVWPDLGSNPRPTTLETSVLNMIWLDVCTCSVCNRNYSAILSTLQITSYAIGVQIALLFTCHLHESLIKLYFNFETAQKKSCAAFLPIFVMKSGARTIKHICFVSLNRFIM